MEKNNQSLFGLASAFGFEYQPVQRLMKGTNTPNITSMSKIAENLNCTISELISDQIIIEVQLVNSYPDLIDKNNSELANIYIPISIYSLRINSDFFAIKSTSIKESDINIYQLYSTCNEINKEGLYLTEYQNKLLKLNVISTSSQFIITEHDGIEERILQAELSPKAEFISKLLIFNSKNKYLSGVQK